MTSKKRDLSTGAANVAVASNAGWIVTLAGTGINLALGVLYTWSVVSQAIPADWGWSEADKSLPYSVAVLMFALMMIPAGFMQDKIGPRLVATLGGVLVGIGLILASFTTSTIGYVIGFGILAGAGIGCGYASATPPAVKWFSKAKTGLIAGIVVSGFGLASVYAAPSAQWLTTNLGMQGTMLVFGVAFFIVVVGLAQLLRTPPAGYVPPEPASASAPVTDKPANSVKPPAMMEDFGAGQMLKTWQFYVLWFMYAAGAGAGLMIISKLSMIASEQAGIALGFILVAVLAIGNGGGRIVAGMISDKIGRMYTLLAFFLLQAVLILLLSQTTQGSWLANPVLLGISSALMGASYGANLAVFPALTKDFYGLRNFGLNYGIVFSAWGVGGFVLSLVAGAIHDSTGSFNQAYFLAAGLLAVAAVLTFVVSTPRVLAKQRVGHTASPAD